MEFEIPRSPFASSLPLFARRTSMDAAAVGRDHVIDHWDHHVHHVNHQPNVHDQCSLVDKFGWLLQGFVLIMAIATLALKRHLERPQRQ